MTDGKRGSSSVPEGWQEGDVSQGVELISGQHIEASLCNDYGLGLPYLTGPADFPKDKVVVTKYTEHPKVMCRNGDILLTVKGSGTGKSVIADGAYCISRQLMAIRPKSFDAGFIFYILKDNEEVYGNKSTGLIPGITRDDVLRTPIHIPPLEEQRKIAAILSAWDKAIEQQTRLIELKRERKRGLMQQLLTGRVRFKEFTGFDWRKVTFDDVLKLEIGGTPARKEPKYWDSERNTKNYWLSIADLKGKNVLSTKERITDLGARKSNTKLIPAGSLVMSFKLTIGRRAILGLPMYTNEAICALIPKDSRAVNVEFLYQYLEIVDFEQNIDQAVKGKTLNKEKIRLLRLSLPTIEEQQKIATVLSAADAELETLTAQLAALHTQKRGLMQRLLTGKTRVQVV